MKNNVMNLNKCESRQGAGASFKSGSVLTRDADVSEMEASPQREVQQGGLNDLVLTEIAKTWQSSAEEKPHPCEKISVPEPTSTS